MSAIRDKEIKRRWALYEENMKEYRMDCVPRMAKEKDIDASWLRKIIEGRCSTAKFSEAQIQAMRIRAANAEEARQAAMPHSRYKLQQEFHISGATFNRIVGLGKHLPEHKKLSPAQAFLRGFKL